MSVREAMHDHGEEQKNKVNLVHALQLYIDRRTTFFPAKNAAGVRSTPPEFSGADRSATEVSSSSAARSQVLRSSGDCCLR